MSEQTVSDELNALIKLACHDTRAGILVTLAGRQHDVPRDPWVSLSTLREEVRHDDDATLELHLNRLVGTFVTHGDRGYRLSNIGQRFVGTLFSCRNDSGRPANIEGEDELSCLLCDLAATITYDGGSIIIECEDGHLFVAHVGQTILDDRPLQDALRCALNRLVFETRSSIEGVCPICNGEMEGLFESTGAAKPPVVYYATCLHCGFFLQTIPSICVLDHPEVVGFCYEYGLDVRKEPYRILSSHIDQGVVDSDPWRAGVTVSINEENLVLQLDNRATVVDARRYADTV